MVRLLLTAVVSFLLWPGLAAAQTPAATPYLQVTLDRGSQELGRFLRTRIRYQGNQKLETINLGGWNKYFAIYPYDESTIQDKNKKTIQIIDLRIYPREEGRIILAALKLGDVASTERIITVTSPQANGSKIKLDWSVSNYQPWQREAITVNVRVDTQDYAAHISLDQFDDPQLITQAIKPITSQRGDNYHHQSGWLIYPLTAGRNTMALPAIRYRISGSDQRLFHLPLVNLDVQPLPPYLPPTLPVGDLNISSQIQDGDKPYWRIQLDSLAHLPDGLAGLDATLARYSQTPLSSITLTNIDPVSLDHLSNQTIYHSPLPNWLSPFGPDLKLTLKYFDPRQGRLVTLEHSLPRTLNIPGWARIISFAAALFTVIFSLYRLWPRFMAWQTRRRLKAEISQCSNADRVRQALLRSGNYRSLNEWATNYPLRQPYISLLNLACFGSNTSHDAELLRYGAIQLLDLP